ncbi:MAG TPA: ABC transporter substrate-binding protein [Acetobacteraceae bacterium]|nr:ABC transporter substrate-binding protein [Acetobacteraceae bacterium]
MKNVVRGTIAAFALAAAGVGMAQGAMAQGTMAPPKEITIGDLYSSTGPFASISMPVYDGLKLWVDETNAAGGAYVKAYDRKIPLKVVSYDDQSNTATAAALTNQLITQDKVDVLVADSGSVLASVSVPVAREHKMFLIDPTGTGAPLFSKDNPYVALVADPASVIWPKFLADFLTDEAAKAGLTRVAILYATNDFTGTQASALKGFVEASHSPAKIVFYKGVPTSTSDYTVLINTIAATHPDMVIELGYVGNDIAFFRNLQDSGLKFRGVFAVYPGSEPEVLVKNVGVAGLAGAFTYSPSNFMHYKPTVGMDIDAFRAAWDKAYPGGKVAFGLNSDAGYVTGLAIGQMLANAPDLTQLGLRKGLYAASGKMTTLAGPFALNEMGEQTGELMPIGQLSAAGSTVKLTVVYPPEDSDGKAVFGPK